MFTNKQKTFHLRNAFFNLKSILENKEIEQTLKAIDQDQDVDKNLEFLQEILEDLELSLIICKQEAEGLE